MKNEQQNIDFLASLDGMTDSQILSALSSCEIEDVPDGKGKSVSDGTAFSLVTADFPDFVVKKVSKKKTSLLVVMPTQGEIYIRNESGGRSSHVEFNSTSYNNFMKGYDNACKIEFPDEFWLRSLEKGSEYKNFLVNVVDNEAVCGMLKAGLFKDVDLTRYRETSYWRTKNHFFDDHMEGCIRAWRECPGILKEYYYSGKHKAKNFITGYPMTVKWLIDSFGLNNTRDFLDEMEVSLLEIGNGSEWSESRHPHRFENDNGRKVYVHTIFPDIKFSYKSFKTYVLYTSVRMGYGSDIRKFCGEWMDTLSMQYTFHGKIKEKYSENLPTFHNQMSYKMLKYKQKIDEEKFACQCENASAYEGKCGEYVFIAPKSKEDFIDEAVQQSNCLASYIDRFTEGRCIILFMRNKKKPDRSFVTIEIIDGKVTQCRMARNVSPAPEIIEIVRKWVFDHNTGNARPAV